MKERKKKTSLVYQKLHTNKTLLFIGVILAVVVDITILVATLLSGMLSWHTAFIGGFILLDCSVMISVALSNFRFSYSKKYPIIYTVLSVVSYAAFIILFCQGVFTRWAAIAFIAVHAIFLVCLLVCVFDASKRGKKLKLAAVSLVTVFLASSVAFVNYTIQSGFFGQGMGYRALSYALDENKDGYAVTGIVDGFGKKIVVPETYNGKKVVAVDASVFSDMENVRLDCDNQTVFTNVANAKLREDLKIYTKKANVDEFKGEFIKSAMVTSSKTNAISLANALLPNDLGKDEVFVAFHYDAEQLYLLNETVIKTWYGKKGDTFDMLAHAQSHEYEIRYVEGYDPSSEAYLYRGYVNNKGWFLDELLNEEGESIQKTAIDESVLGVKLRFAKVYEITVGEDNDTVAEDDLAFKSFESTGKRYVSVATAANLLAQHKTRKGFSLAWEYSSKTTYGRTSLNSLPSILNEKVSSLMIYPTWSLNAPVVNGIDFDKTNYVYGDSMALTPDVSEAELAEVSYTYSWKNDTLGIQKLNVAEPILSLSKVTPNSSVFELTVTAQAPTITSLTSERVMSTDEVVVGKKPLDVVWSCPTTAAERLYDNTYKTISCSLDAADFVAGDSVTTDWYDRSVRNVGDYTYTVSLTGGFADLYELQNAIKQVTITPREIELNWVPPSFTYNRTTQTPNYAIEGDGFVSDGSSVSLSGAGMSAGKHTITANILGTNATNYVITQGKSYDYSIAKKPVTLSWGEDSFVYDGTKQAPTATVNDVVSGDTVNADVVGGETNARNSAYTATATLDNANYTIDGDNTKSFTISPKPVSVSWTNTSLTYNAQSQKPTATTSDLEGSDRATITVRGAQKNAGTSYTATAESINNPNYVLGSNTTTTFSISKRSANVSWGATSFTYNGKEQCPTVTLDICAGDQVTATVEGAATNARTTAYTANVTGLTGADASNYNLTGTLSKNFTIAKKSLTASWSNTTVTYNGEGQAPKVTLSGGLSGDTLGESVAIRTGTAKNVGSYTAEVTVSNSNYTVSTHPTTTFTIKQKGINVTWSDTTVTYNGGIQYPTVEITPSDVETGDSLDANVIGKTSAGEYSLTATLSGTGSANYKINNATHEFVILQKEVTLSWSNTTTTYNGIEQKPTVNVSGGVLGGDVVIATVGGKTDADTYTLTASLTGADSNNYVIKRDNKSQQFTINKKSVTIEWTNTTFDYDGTMQAPTATLNGVETGDDVGVSVTGAQANVGTHTATASLTGADKDNYELTVNKTCNFTINAVAVEE